jgi:hypothetical protein
MSAHDDARAWLAGRRAGVPPALHARMIAALDEALDDGAPAVPGVPGALGAAALACLRAALPHCDERAAALHLLAADALITAACEAAAQDADDAAAAVRAVRAVCAAYAPARLASLVPRS